ncbi:hypothetical protein ACHHYP_03258 [Achlya hypogyna]|uniref:Uncharacterized protein n=1 Tax=Achlya hypogyna TaxID=1202772 RepID=A0A1V9ZS67_ACHHY|nr:hypothetical protein ACHHYP_03258 [Achlya hypogyna]
MKGTAGEAATSNGLRRFELRVSARDFLAARGHQTTMLVTMAGEQHHSSLERMSHLLTERRVLHAITSVGGIKTLVSVDDLPALWSSASAVGSTMNMRKQPGPMPDVVRQELCVAMVIMALKMNGYVAMGDAGTYMLPKQTRPHEVQAVYFSDMRLVHDEVVATFSPVVYHLNKVDATVQHIITGAMGQPISDESLGRQLSSLHSVFALPKMNHCRIVEYSSHLPQLTNLIPRSSADGLCKHVPQTEPEYRRYWLEVHGIHLPAHLGGYLRVQFPSGDCMTYPATCVATNWHILSKQSHMETHDITRALVVAMHGFFGAQAVRVQSEQFEPKVATLLPASALLQSVTMASGTGALRKRDEHQAPALTKRKKVY